MKYILTLFLMVLFFGGCMKEKSDKMQEIHWDRDMCELCKMVISDRGYGVEVVNPHTGKSYKFDDLGCAILWFKENKPAWEKDAKIYIADAKTKKFIDAKKAFYDIGSTTPMDYGFSAYENKDEVKFKNHLMSFDEVRLAILRGETMQNPYIKKQLRGN